MGQGRGSIAICGPHHVTLMSGSAKRIAFVSFVKEYFMTSIACGDENQIFKINLIALYELDMLEIETLRSLVETDCTQTRRPKGREEATQPRPWFSRASAFCSRLVSLPC